jgi:hypothetical protein
MRHRHYGGAAVALATLAAVLGGCGAADRSREARIPPALLREMRPIGRGPRFQPPVRGPVTGPCRRALGPRFGVHVEVFAANRVVIIPAGIGTAPPRRSQNGAVTGARCYGALVTLQPTGVVLVRPGTAPTVAELFRSWGQPLGRARIASFAGGRVRAFVGGRRASVRAAAIRLTPHAEIVTEIGPFVPPHKSFTFPPGM